MPEQLHYYECKHCGMRFIKEDFEESGIDLEEVLWGHVQTQHEALFDEVQDLETPDMINQVYTLNAI